MTHRRLSLLVCLAVCVSSVLVHRTGAQPAATLTRQSDVIYGRKFGVALTMEVFTPPTRNGLGVVWVVSSGGVSSREQTLQDSFERRIAPLLTRGYTVFAVIHGSAPIFNVQDMSGDVRRAVRVVRARAADFRIDGQRLAIAGSSAGGLLALTIAMHGDEGKPADADPIERVSSRVQAAGVFFPPTDLMHFGAPSQTIVDVMLKQGGLDPAFQFYDPDARTGARTPIADREKVLQLLREMSPVTHATADDPPTILIHGDQDKGVPIQQSQSLMTRLTELKVPSRLVVREGAGHAYPGWEADTRLIADWFDQHLRK